MDIKKYNSALIVDTGNGDPAIILFARNVAALQVISHPIKGSRKLDHALRVHLTTSIIDIPGPSLTACTALGERILKHMD